MTARDQARQWLAELIAKRCPGCSEQSNGWEHIRAPEADYLADAILDAERVEVETAYEHDPTGPRIAILMPAEPAQDRRMDAGASDGTQGPGEPISAGRIAQRLAAFANDPDWLLTWLTAHGLGDTAGPAAVINALAHDWQGWAVTHPDSHTPDQR